MYLLRLVNKEHPLADTFVPADLIQDPDSKIWLSKNALNAFLDVNHQMVQEGFNPLLLISGYRPYGYQLKLYQAKINTFIQKGLSKLDAEQQASQIVAPPGCSEHQLGLALDITSYDFKDLKDPLIEDFCYTAEGIWLQQHAHQYGFILRYPLDKVWMTQITYEPWHYRYVGIDHATHIKTYNMCLEEYLLTYLLLGGKNEEL